MKPPGQLSAAPRNRPSTGRPKLLLKEDPQRIGGFQLQPSGASVFDAAVDTNGDPTAGDETSTPSLRPGPGTSSRQASLEVYGFAIWILSFVGFGLYLLWAYLPEELLHQIGWTYYPSQYWAVALPSYVVMMVPVVLLAYIGWNFRHTNALDDIHTVTDMYSRSATRHVTRLEMLDDRMPEIADIPIHVVNQVLYSTQPIYEHERPRW